MPTKGLLADRDQSAIAREQVPELRQHQHGEDEEHVLDQAARGKGRQGDCHTMRKSATIAEI
jgi:hypothetical protein